jgi:predicted transcriptional regulator
MFGRMPKRTKGWVQTYWIERADQIQAVISPLRQEIIDHVATLGPIGVRDLARVLGRRTTAVYYHVQKLERVGLLRARLEPSRHSRRVAVYETITPRVRLARAAYKPANRGRLSKAARSAAVQSARDYAAGFRARAWKLEGPERNHWFFRVVTSPAPRRLARINALLNELAELVWTADARPGPRLSVTWFLAPLDAAKPATQRKPRKPRKPDPHTAK